MKKLSKTATIGSIAFMSAAIIATAIQTKVNVKDTTDETVYFESNNDLVTDTPMQGLAEISSEEYSSYLAQSDDYLSDVEIDVQQENAKEDNEADTAEDTSDDTIDAATDETSDVSEEEDAEQETSEFDTVAISVANPYVNVRKAASEDSEILGKLYKGAIGEIVLTEGDWVKIESGSVTGYVKAEYIISGDDAQKVFDEYTRKIATVTTQTLRVRSEATTESSIITQVAQGEKFEVVSESDGWVKIDVEGSLGYVSSDYLEFSYDYDTAISIEEEKKALEEAAAAEAAALKKEQEAKKAAEAAAAKKAAEEKAAAEAKKAAEEAAAKKAAEEKAAADNTQKTQTTTSGAMSYSDDDLKLLTCLIQAEAGGESYEAQLAVANVVLNRVKSSSFPNSISGVIYQSGQFGVVSNGALSRRLNNYTASGNAYKAAKAALNGTNNIGTRKYFNRTDATGSHSNSVVIGLQVFW